MVRMNPFRILGDVSHTLSKCILIWTIHSNSSAEGVSLITQSLYTLVFLTRYTDLFGPIFSVWNFVLKIFYILSSIYILFLMLRIYARTREREKAWKLGGVCLGASAVLAPLVMMVFEKKFMWGLQEILWVFSIILESICILPQLLLLRQTTVPTVLTSFYLLTLGSYRAFYILNWIWRELDTNDRKPDAISIVFGVVQTAFYIDFAWVYWGRQRVKLRNGGVVDQDDFGRGWLLTRVLGKRAPRQLRVEDDADEEDEESAPALGRRGGYAGFDGAVENGNGNVAGKKAMSKWGKRGISVSADEGTLEDNGGFGDELDGVGSQQSGVVAAGVAPNGQGIGIMRDPEEMARVLDEDDDEEPDDVLPVTGGGAEWRDESR